MMMHAEVNTNSQDRFKITMLQSNLWDYSDTCIRVKWNITFAGTGADVPATETDERIK